MRNNAKRLVSIALALFICISMMTCIVLPTAAAASAYPEVWGTYGLAPTGSETYVDLTSQSLHDARTGTLDQDPNYDDYKSYFMALAPDWTQYAHETYAGALNGSADDMFTEIKDAEDDDAATPDTILHIGDEFYAKMPTTGIIYKFRFAYTAGDPLHTSAYVCHTLLLFPGEYDTKFTYDTNSADIKKAQNSYGAYYTESNYSEIVGAGDDAAGKLARAQMVLGFSNSTVRLIGPQAGVSAANTADGTVANNRAYNDTTKEAYFKDSTTYIYVRNRLYEDGASLTLDGISASSNWKIDTRAGGGAKWHTAANAGKIFTINVKNCLFDQATVGLFMLYARDSDVDNGNDWATKDDILNKAYACGNLKIENTYYKSTSVSDTNLDSIQINNSVIKTTSTMGSFRINPSRGDFNTAKVDLNYSMKNSYFEGTKGFLYGVYYNTTVDLDKVRTGIVTEFENNKVVNLGMETDNSTRGVLYYEFGSSFNDVEGYTRGANTIKALANIKRVLTVKNNVFLNDTGAEKDTTPANIIATYSAGTENADISGNTFTGYNVGALFDVVSSSVNVSNNLYLAADQTTIVSAKVKSGKVDDIVLSTDYKVKASDFKITEGVNSTTLTWTNKGTDAWADLNTEGNATAVLPWTETATAEQLISTLDFASDKVSASSLTYWDGTAIGASDTFTEDTTFALTLAHADSTKTLTYKLSLACPHKNVTNSTETDAYLKPTCGDDGYQKVICDKCLEPITQPLPATGDHTPETVAYTDQQPTCYQSGKGYTYCTVCEDILAENVTVDPTGEHVYDITTWSKDKNGHWHACTAADGCTAQGDFAIHSESAPIAYEGKEATCHSDGEGYIECTECGYVINDKAVIPATDKHDFEVDPSHNADGHWYVCAYDGCDATTKIEEHISSDVIAYGDMPATCTTAGMGYTICTVCGGIDKTNITIPAIGHTNGEWETVLPATYLNEGIEQRMCAVCGDPTGETRKVAKTAKIDVLTVFDDISASAWYYKNGAADFGYNLGLLTGTDKDTFTPNGVVTRGMFVTVLGRLHGVEVAKTTLTKFTDIQKTAYYAGYVKWASDNGIVNGVTDYAFAPTSSITREQMCTILARYCDYADIELKETKAAAAFTDANSISGYAKAAVTACQKAGLVQGKGNGKFDPKGTATRAEVSTILMNFYVSCVL